VGHKSNHDGIGSVVKVTTSTGPQWVIVTTSSGYLSASDPRAHFGLGSDSAASKIEIRWPSGILQVLNNVKGDQILEVPEPQPPATSKAPK
jgi:hypothetical protein